MPASIPVITPVDALAVAMAVLPLLHIPDGVISLSVIVKPSHTFVAPPITAGNGFTVPVAVMIQVVGRV